MINQLPSSLGARPDQDQRGNGQERRVLFTRAATAIGVASLALGSLAALAPASSAAQPNAKAPASLQAANVAGFGEILTNSHGFSLYGLSDESTGKFACTGKCLSFWPPMLVSSNVKKVSVGAGVTGAIGFIKRSATAKQVTFDGYPLYQFVKDTAAGQTHGEGVVAFGGTWGLLRAESLVLPAKSAPTTTTTATTGATTPTTGASTTTTTAPGY